MQNSEERRYDPDDFVPYLVDEVPVRPVEPTGDRIPEGLRNDTLFRWACSMRAKGFEEDAILAAISVVNRTKCDPPLSESEVRTLVHSACGYDRGSSGSFEDFAVPTEPENLPAAS